MAAGTTIKLKRKAGAFIAGDLAIGELGLDTTNSILYGSIDGSTVFIVNTVGSSGLTTQVLVGGGAGVSPVWTTATGTGSPVRAESPTISPVDINTSALTVSGAWSELNTGGSGAPHIVADSPANATWSVSGTGLGLNAPSGFVGDFFNLRVNNTEVASIDYNGDLNIANITSTGNIKAINVIGGFTTTATAAGTTTLTNTSTYTQEFTGTTTQTVELPTTSVVAGQSYHIINNSTGAVTVRSSNTSLILTIADNDSANFTALVNTPTTAAHWEYMPSLKSGISTQILVGGGSTSSPVWTTATGSGSPVRATSPTFTTSVIGDGTMAVFNTASTTINAFGAATTINIGGTPTSAITHNYSTNATATATTKTVNFGTGGAAGSTTNINIGSSVAGTTTLNSPNISLGGTTGATTTGTIQLGHASDTTLSRSAAGRLAVEGVGVITGVLGTAVSASGTSVDFTGIPSWAKRVVLTLSVVSFDTANDNLLFQIGDSGGVETSGYGGSTSMVSGATTTSSATISSGFNTNDTAATAGSNWRGVVTFDFNNDSNSWFISAIISNNTFAARVHNITGGKALSATLDRVRVTSVSGTSNFDNGIISMYYEG
jgi:hypothetical protein